MTRGPGFTGTARTARWTGAVLGAALSLSSLGCFWAADVESGEPCIEGSHEDYFGLLGIRDGGIAWSRVVDGEHMNIAPAVADHQGGLVFATKDDTWHLVRHAADGSRTASHPLDDEPADVAIDREGRIVYAGVVDEVVRYVELDAMLRPLHSPRAVPWVSEPPRPAIRIAAAPGRKVVVATGDYDGGSRRIGTLDSAGNEVWSTPWPVAVELEPGDVGIVTGVAILEDGTIGLAIRSRESYFGETWIEAFTPYGEHLWTVGRDEFDGRALSATRDTFVLSGRRAHGMGGLAAGYDAQGELAWEVPVDEMVGPAEPCGDDAVVFPTATGYGTRTSGSTVSFFGVDLRRVDVPYEDFDDERIDLRQVVCTSAGDIVVLENITLSIPDSDGCLW